MSKTATQLGQDKFSTLPDVVMANIAYGDFPCFDGAVWSQCATSLTAPGAAAGSNAGTSPPAPVVTAGANDLRGNITFGTGTTPAAGNEVVVTFGTAFSTAPTVIVAPANVATAALQIAAISVTTTGFTLACNTAPAASQANTVYAFNYWVVR